jgi:hypothetical protein
MKVKYPGTVKEACQYADDGKGSRVKDFYVCHEGSTPHKQDRERIKLAQAASVAANTGRKRPDHSKLMTQLNEQRKDPTIYQFTHNTGLTFLGTRHQLIETYPDHKISASELGMLIRGQYKSHRGWKLTP